jgi:O-acetylhomoserine/O-acetylserine sulfhydrylase-like pyridoxal-dependent enzyme
MALPPPEAPFRDAAGPRRQGPAEQKASGVTPDQIRVSVGIEHIDGVREDFEEAFAAAR